MLITSIVVMVLQMYTQVKTSNGMLYVQSIVCQLYLNKGAKFINESRHGKQKA